LSCFLAEATQAILRDRVLTDPEAVAALLAGLHLYVRDTFKVRRLLQPTATAAERAAAADAAAASAAAASAAPPAAEQPAADTGGEAAAQPDAAAVQLDAAPQQPAASGPSVLSVLMGVKPLQHALIDLLMDLMVTACQNAKKVELGLLLPPPADRQPPARPPPTGAQPR
jgi:hypothetical protein